MIFPQSPRPARRKRPNWREEPLDGGAFCGRPLAQLVPACDTNTPGRQSCDLHSPPSTLSNPNTHLTNSFTPISLPLIHSHTTPLPTNTLSQHRQYGQSRCGVPQLSSPTHCCNHTSLTRTSRSRRRCRWWYWSGKIIPLVLPYPRLPH